MSGNSAARGPFPVMVKQAHDICGQGEGIKIQEILRMSSMSGPSRGNSLACYQAIMCSCVVQFPSLTYAGLFWALHTYPFSLGSMHTLQKIFMAHNIGNSWFYIVPHSFPNLVHYRDDWVGQDSYKTSVGPTQTHFSLYSFNVVVSC